MKLRDAQIPLALWISAATVVHLGGGHAAAQAAELVGEWRDLLSFSRDVRTLVRPTEVEIEVLEEAEPTKEEEKEPEEETLAVDDDPLAVEPLARPEPAEPEPEPPEPAVEEKEEPQPEQVAEPEPKDPTTNPQQLLLPKPDGRIAVKQHQEADQSDNPNAPRIADEAHHTAEETMARIRAYDQDSPDPSPGKPHPGPHEDEGNSHESEAGYAVASEEPGETRPGELEGDDEPLPPAPPRPESPSNPSPPRPAVDAPATPGRPGVAPVPGQAGQVGGSGEPSPEALTSPGGEYSLDPSGGDGRPRQQARQRRRGMRGIPAVPGPMGFNQPGPHNLSLPGLMDAIGQEQLQQERERARNARKRKHRGAFAGADFQRYRAAIENYDPSVKPGNQTSLNAARVPFASYINKMHNRIHPVFADGFLGSLDKLSRDDPLNQKLVTHLELVLDREKGRTVRLGITKPSGVTAFDLGALKSAESAGPFGPPPEAIISPDGRVYLHWEFHRDPYYACTSRYARPYLLKNKPKTKAGPLRPEKPGAPPSADERYRRPPASKKKSGAKGRKKAPKAPK